jgi:hypothetical protein
METTLIEARALHSEKASDSMLVTPLPMVTQQRMLQPLKAPCPILVMLLGIVMEVSAVSN